MIVGLCRFSYLARERALGWNSVPREPEAARAIVFDEARLAARFRLFERYTLPSLGAQTDGDFRLIVLTSAELPARHRARLADLVAADRRIRLVAAPARDGPRLLRRLFAEAFGDAPRRVSFRIDDDDGLSVRFVERLRAALARAQGPGPLFVSFSKGIVVRYRDGAPDGTPLWASQCAHPFLSPGLAFAAEAGGPDARRCVYDFVHPTCHRHFDALVLAGTPAYVRCLHGFNAGDARPHGVRGYPRRTLDELARAFAADFPYLVPAPAPPTEPTAEPRPEPRDEPVVAPA